jgi:predicted nucleotidyltransferase
MSRNHPKPVKPAESTWGYRYRSPDIPMSAIRRFARQIADRFHPDKIILFGSYAYGQPHQESDVDLLVVMPASNEINQSIRLTLAFEPPFSLDLIVRTPENLRSGLEEGDWFLREIVAKGKVLYEKADSAMGAQSGGRSGRSKRSRKDQSATP